MEDWAVPDDWGINGGVGPGGGKGGGEGCSNVGGRGGGGDWDNGGGGEEGKGGVVGGEPSGNGGEPSGKTCSSPEMFDAGSNIISEPWSWKSISEVLFNNTGISSFGWPETSSISSSPSTSSKIQWRLSLGVTVEVSDSTRMWVGSIGEALLEKSLSLSSNKCEDKKPVSWNVALLKHSSQIYNKNQNLK